MIHHYMWQLELKLWRHVDWCISKVYPISSIPECPCCIYIDLANSSMPSMSY
eukprot:c35480_g1_i1 orf=132-287(+)